MEGSVRYFQKALRLYSLFNIDGLLSFSLSLSLSLFCSFVFKHIFKKFPMKVLCVCKPERKIISKFDRIICFTFFFEKWKLIFLKEEKCLLVNKRLFMLTPISNFQTIKHLAKTGYFETKLSWKVLTLPQPTTVSLHSNSLKERLEIKRWKNVKCEASPRKIISITERIRSV